MVDEADARDPAAYAKSLNAYRRHLTPQQRTDAIIEAIKSDPAKSDRQIAKETKTSHPRVARERAKLEKTGDVERVPHRADALGREQPSHKSKSGAPPADQEQSAATDQIIVANIAASFDPRMNPLASITPERVWSIGKRGDLVGMSSKGRQVIEWWQRFIDHQNQPQMRPLRTATSRPAWTS